MIFYTEFEEYPLGLDPNLILDNVYVDEVYGCWVWMKSFTTPGYGQIWYKGKRYDTHRYSYMCFNGPIPQGYLVRHMCHHPCCCNPEHLEVGTYLDNYNDSREMYAAIRIKTGFASRKKYIINGIAYVGVLHASNCTGLTQQAIIKYTDPVTRVFNTDLYRRNCAIGNSIPRV